MVVSTFFQLSIGRKGMSLFPVSEFPTVSNWTSTRVPGVVNIVGYDNDVADFYVPIFTILEYQFYMGWLKVEWEI